MLKHFCLLVFFVWFCFPMNAQKKSDTKLVISFISIGTGIDYKATEQLSSYVQDFQEKYQVQLDPTIKNWGREGETDYTYDLKKLTKKQCKAFVEKIEEMYTENNRVKISHSSLD